MNDLISRQAVFDEIWNLRRSLQLLDDTQRADLVMHGIYLVEKFVEKLPSVQPKERCIATITFSEEDLKRIVKEQVEEIKDLLPRKGKWIGKERFANSQEYFSWECDKCEWVLEDITLYKPYSFCPNCGADMREGDQDV